MLKFEERDTNSRETCFTLGYFLIHFIWKTVRQYVFYERWINHSFSFILKINGTQILSKKYFIEITR